MNPAFWKNRPVFITGHTGFKGAWLSLWLHSLGSRVIGFSLDPPTTPSLFALSRATDLLDDRRGDVRNAAPLRSALEQTQPEIVVHMAAQSLVRTAYQIPIDTYATNVMGTVHLLDAVRHVPSVRAVIVVTSDKCYENRGLDRGYREEDEMGGYDPYSSSKGCAELVTSAYRRSFFQDHATRRPSIASCRAGNVIGGGDWACDRLFPDLLAAFAEGRPAAVRNPQATRPWQHVLEPLHGYLMLAERLSAGDEGFEGGWNFGPPRTDVRTVASVSDAAARAWGNGSRWEQDRSAQPHEARDLTLDITKAERQLDWHPVLSVDAAVEWTVRWRKRLNAGQSARELTMNDIGEYGALLARGSR
jgi:CDP-glucose 4,6-dehydratase